MLVLARYKGQSFNVTCPDGTPMVITITEIDKAGGGRPRVKVGFDAPADVKIVRAEVDGDDKAKESS